MAKKTARKKRRKKNRKKKVVQRKHNVYVIELEKAVLEVRRFEKANPDCDPTKAFLYVGRTGLTPDERFEKHKAGIRSCSLVRDHGKYLRRRMYEKYNPMTYDEACKMEVELAEQLRRKGHAVWQK